MRIFLLVYLAIYGGANFYLFWKLSHALRRGVLVNVALAVFIVVMVLGPILVRLLERADWTRTADWLGLIAYTWMPITLWFVFLAGAADLWNLGVLAVGHFRPEAHAWALPLRPTVAIIGSLIVLGGLWGLREATQLHLEHLTLRSPHLQAGEKPLRIVQISDVHLGLIQRERRLNHVLTMVRSLKPDLLVSTGDLVDGTATHMNGLAEMLAAIKPPLGKYAVLGNHEYYIGLHPSLAFHDKAGFKVLRGESVRVNENLRIAGVDDPAGGWRHAEMHLSEQEALNGSTDGSTTILLKHRPDIRDSSLGRFALQLSGHTHKGQIFPFGLFVRLQYPWLSGYHPLAKGSALYISRGTGTWGAPLRLAAPPEVTLITIEPAAS